MPLGPAELQKIQAWMQKTFVGALSCPVCRMSGWSVNDQLVIASTWMPGGVALGGGGIPMVQFECTNCGHILHFAAGPIGLVPQPPP
jgi:hypothetical protein